MVLLAIISSVIDYFKNNEFSFKVTPKGNVMSEFDFKSLLPNFTIILFCFTILSLAIWGKNINHQHFYILLLLIANITLIVTVLFLNDYDKHHK